MRTLSNRFSGQAEMTVGRPLALALCALLVGGAPPDTTAEGTIVRDSAGVTVVTSAAPLWPADGPSITLAAEPDIEIGVLDGIPSTS
jgi:hypothetical protein